MEFIEYKGGFKYQLHADYRTRLSFGGPKLITIPHIVFFPDGWLDIKKGYAWDGPSGPTIDTKTFMRGSLVHDALYQLIRQGELAMSFRKHADDELKQICTVDGMTRLRAWWVHRALVRAGRAAALPSAIKRIHRAP